MRMAGKRNHRSGRRASSSDAQAGDDWSNRIATALTGRGHDPETPAAKPRRYGRRLAIFGAVMFLLCGGAVFGLGSHLIALDQAEADPNPIRLAQASGDPPVPPAKPTAPAAKPAAPAAKPSSAAPKAGSQKFGDWVLLCEDAAQMARKSCFVAQQIAEELSKQVVFAWRLQYDGEGKLIAVFRTPTGVYVNRGIVLKLGDAEKNGLKVAYQLCDEKKCQAVADVSDEILKSLSAVKAVSASLALTSGKTASVNISMSGFPAAMAALAKLK